jgi:hypothetical protein
MTGSSRILLLFVQKITYLDLCHTPIYEQFYTCNITTIIRREERDSFGDFVRTSHSTHRHAGYNARLELLDLFLSLCQLPLLCIPKVVASLLFYTILFMGLQKNGNQLFFMNSRLSENNFIKTTMGLSVSFF